jgi:phage tail sheath protein FI
MAFLHGVETIPQKSGPVPVQVVNEGVIGLVGIAPMGPQNVVTQVNNDTDAAQFGSPLVGFNIPRALKHIFQQGAGTVLVVNVFDPATHTSQVTAEVHTIANGKFKLSFNPIGAVAFTDNSDVASTLVKDVDYSLDEYGNFTALKSTAANGTVLKATYKKLNSAAITSAVIIGANTNDTRTGLQCFDVAKNVVGFLPKILLASDYSSVSQVAAEMIVKADKYRALPLIDAPYGTTVSGAIAGRGLGGTINFNTSSKRAVLLYPYLKAYDIATDSNQDFPYSEFMAGVISSTRLNEGFWVSPSNKEIKGVVGVERTISAGINDTGSDANTLNASGITTIFNAFGTGIRTWGNRNASYPSNTAPDNFISVQSSADVIHEALESAVFQFIDQPITKALIDVIRETGNNFIRTLVGRGALIAGSRVEFPPELNTPTEIAAGHLTYNLIMMPSVPAERITMRSFIDINILKGLTAG